MRRIFLGVTGASGAVYAGHALRALTAAGCHVGLCVSHAGAQQFVERWAEGPGEVTVLGLDDLTAPFASGSSTAPAALICPCSGSTLAAIAHGTARNLIHRCADVMLKERRTLVLMTRETPLNLIHIENMATVTRAGALVMPAMPGFYNHPAAIEDLVDFMVGKALDHLGVPHALLGRWGEEPERAVAGRPGAPGR